MCKDSNDTVAREPYLSTLGKVACAVDAAPFLLVLDLRAGSVGGPSSRKIDAPIEALAFAPGGEERLAVLLPTELRVDGWPDVGVVAHGLAWRPDGSEPGLKDSVAERPNHSNLC